MPLANVLMCQNPGGARWLAGRQLQRPPECWHWVAQIRMVQNVKRFHTQLKLVMFVPGHADALVNFGVNGKNSGSERRVSSDVAVCPDRSQREGAAVVPSFGLGLSMLEPTPVEFGRSYVLWVMELSKPPMLMFSGIPLCSVKIPPTCQPPTMALARELLMFSRLPLPMGSS